MKKRWQNFQADNPKKGYNKTVDELTEAEAKEEWCDAMEVIQKMMACADDVIEIARKANYST